METDTVTRWCCRWPPRYSGAQRALQAKGVRGKVHSKKGCHFIRRKWGSLVLPDLSTQRGAGLHGRKVAMLAEINDAGVCRAGQEALLVMLFEEGLLAAEITWNVSQKTQATVQTESQKHVITGKVPQASARFCICETPTYLWRLPRGSNWILCTYTV